jgi:hypothetical protein
MVSVCLRVSGEQEGEQRLQRDGVRTHRRCMGRLDQPIDPRVLPCSQPVVDAGTATAHRCSRGLRCRAIGDEDQRREPPPVADTAFVGSGGDECIMFIGGERHVHGHLLLRSPAYLVQPHLSIDLG